MLLLKCAKSGSSTTFELVLDAAQDNMDGLVVEPLRASFAADKDGRHFTMHSSNGEMELFKILKSLRLHGWSVLTSHALTRGSGSDGAVEESTFFFEHPSPSPSSLNGSAIKPLPDVQSIIATPVSVSASASAAGRNTAQDEHKSEAYTSPSLPTVTVSKAPTVPTVFTPPIPVAEAPLSAPVAAPVPVSTPPIPAPAKAPLSAPAAPVPVSVPTIAERRRSLSNAPTGASDVVPVGVKASRSASMIASPAAAAAFAASAGAAGAGPGVSNRERLLARYNQHRRTSHPRIAPPPPSGAPTSNESATVSAAPSAALSAAPASSASAPAVFAAPAAIPPFSPASEGSEDGTEATGIEGDSDRKYPSMLRRLSTKRLSFGFRSSDAEPTTPTKPTTPPKTAPIPAPAAGPLAVPALAPTPAPTPAPAAGASASASSSSSSPAHTCDREAYRRPRRFTNALRSEPASEQAPHAAGHPAAAG
eukprot:CAMPEP_0173246050 /NCGR_PEP_ID=MMETSP1142-20121109/17090_1 /TAXON_ID=483371 /ORGANISM="non described non described, Strain CCMP2298" /LENGTH=476 /DNA_ID=CAMNT_0014178207 /DNA_START=164 /DNA_END=1593 /DNA_ORIENTATION=+